MNGQRIELGEIETAISKLVPAVAVVADSGRLIAFYTGVERPDLRDQLSLILPRNMIPAVFVHIDEMPLTMNGKTDRAKLPHLERSIDLPLTEIEAQLCDLFSEVLDNVPVGRNDNFFDLGGTSLGMMELLCSAPLERLSPSDFMAHATPAELAAFLESEQQSSIIVPLYVPDKCSSAIVLFSYGGGDVAAYTSLVSEFRRRQPTVALYYCPWLNDYEEAEKELRLLSHHHKLSFYSHCAGAVTALKLIDRLNANSVVIKHFFAGAVIPPAHSKNIWHMVPNTTLLRILQKAGMPELPEAQSAVMLRNFRANTDEFFDYFLSKSTPTPITVTVVLSKNDFFTKDYEKAEGLWRQYVSDVDSIVLLDCPSHYYQSSQAEAIADILLAEVD